jgi:hypothetical protein
MVGRPARWAARLPLAFLIVAFYGHHLHHCYHQVRQVKMDLIDILSCYNKNEERWENLKKLYNISKIIPFIGAGMSVPIYPQWADAIRNILNGDEDELTMLDTYFAENNYEGACEYVKEKIGEFGIVKKSVVVKTH